MKKLIILAAALTAAACSTTPDMDSGGCTQSDRAYLAGLKAGASSPFFRPDSENGKRTLDDIARLEMKCVA